MNDEIKTLFKTRDKAVDKKDKHLFLTTQIGEIENNASEGYIATQKLSSEVLFTYSLNDLEATAFVKETYTHENVITHSAFLLYSLVNTVHGWKIYRVK